MCGICGAVSLDNQSPIDPAALDAMAQTLVHRGPDSAGTVIQGAAGLATRRLAVIDLPGGDQPLANEDGSIHVVCNGEIYNFRELRDELATRGHPFRSAGDCEVVVHAYEEFGLQFVSRLNGMFGLAVWDNRRRRLLLARDRVGIKPLYYALYDGRLLFGSEPKAILAYPGFPRALDLESLSQYLTYEYVPTPGCIFRGIRKLRPGHFLRVEHGQIQELPYASLQLQPDPSLSRQPEAELAEELWREFRAAVAMEMVSDVPLGVLLSGGLDSSAVAAAMVEIGDGPVRSFCIGFEDSSFDESGHARRVATHLGTRHEELVLEPGHLFDLVPRIANVLDEPLADPSIIPTYLLAGFARRHVTVALGGDGGDEIFAGYPTYQAHQLARYYRRLPRALRETVITPLVQRLPVSLDNMSLDFRARKFVSAADLPLPERHHLWLGAFTPEEKRALLQPDVLDQLRDSDTFAILDEHVGPGLHSDDLARALYLDMKMYLEGDILVKVDRAGMACSLEVRVPFLNERMLAFAARLPSSLKLHGLTRKYLLRKALRGRLPESMIRRKKKGFGIPVAKWLQGDLRPMLLDLLAEDRLKQQSLFDPSCVVRLVRDHLDGRRDNRKLLWTLVMFQLWHERHLAPSSSRSGVVVA